MNDPAASPPPTRLPKRSGETSTRERRRRSPETRRREIMQAAIRLFDRNGYDGTTTKEIAREAGISEGTIYTYFGGKQDLLFSFIEETALHSLSSLMARLEGVDDRRAIRAILEDRFALWERNRPVIKIVFAEALFRRELAEALHERIFLPAAEALEAFFQERIDRGAFRKVHPGIAARAFVGGIFSFNLLWEAMRPDAPRPYSREDLVESLTSLFLDGIHAPSEQRLPHPRRDAGASPGSAKPVEQEEGNQ